MSDEIPLPRDVEIRLCESVLAIAIHRSADWPDIAAKPELRTRDVLKRSADLVVKNFLTDLQPIMDWLQSTKPGQQTAYFLDQELAWHPAGDRLAARAPQLVDAVIVGGSGT